MNRGACASSPSARRISRMHTFSAPSATYTPGQIASSSSVFLTRRPGRLTRYSSSEIAFGVSATGLESAYSSPLAGSSRKRSKVSGRSDAMRRVPRQPAILSDLAAAERRSLRLGRRSVKAFHQVVDRSDQLDREEATEADQRLGARQPPVTCGPTLAGDASDPGRVADRRRARPSGARDRRKRVNAHESYTTQR